MTSRRRNLPLALATSIMLLVPATSALADNLWKQSNTLWRQMDKCTRAAQRQYPDHTAEAIAKRDQVRRQCLRAANLPGDSSAPDEEPAQPTAEQH